MTDTLEQRLDNIVQQPEAKPTVPLITLDEYYMGRDKLFPEELSDAHRMNAQRTIDAANAILAKFGAKRHVVSGWRPAAINAATRGAAPNSKHTLCQAIDLEDNNKELMNYLLNNQDVMEQIGIWCERSQDTRTWVHMQIVPPGSGKRFFQAF